MTCIHISKLKRTRPFLDHYFLTLAAFFLLVCVTLPGFSQAASTAPAVPSQTEASTYPVNRFEFAIRHFEAIDKQRMPAPEGTLFIGSSTFAHWKTLETEFKDLNAVNRGFGGCTIPEINHYIDRIAIKYKPARVVFYAGTNDIADGHSALTVFNDYKKFVEKIHAALPKTQIYFIAMSIPPSRLKWQPEYDEGNRLIQQYVASAPYLHYIDVLPVMRDKDGKLRYDLFLGDRLHMTPAGYAAWTPIIRKALEPSGRSL